MPAIASISRRQLLKGRSLPPPLWLLPPGMVETALDACTGCAACVEACPEKILFLTSGKVALDPGLGECTFCGACAEACPEPVFAAPLTIAHRFAITDDCLARSGITCMTCRDACPESAISMRPRIGGPFLPEIALAACTGCGACVAPCPSEAITAIREEAPHEQ